MNPPRTEASYPHFPKPAVRLSGQTPHRSPHSYGLRALPGVFPWGHLPDPKRFCPGLREIRMRPFSEGRWGHGKTRGNARRPYHCVTCVAFDPKGERLVSGSRDKTLRLWEGSTGKPLATLEGHTDGVTCVAFDPKGERLVSGSGDKTLRLWEGSTGKPLATLEGHTQMW